MREGGDAFQVAGIFVSVPLCAVIAELGDVISRLRGKDLEQFLAQAHMTYNAHGRKRAVQRLALAQGAQ